MFRSVYTLAASVAYILACSRNRVYCCVSESTSVEGILNQLLKQQSPIMNEDERMSRLKRTLHSLATRVPRIVLKRVELMFPGLNKGVVSIARTY